MQEAILLLKFFVKTMINKEEFQATPSGGAADHSLMDIPFDRLKTNTKIPKTHCHWQFARIVPSQDCAHYKDRPDHWPEGILSYDCTMI